MRASASVERWAVTATLVALSGACQKDSTAPKNLSPVTSFISQLTTSDQSVIATAVQGNAPSGGSGPTATGSGTGNFVRGGSSMLTLTSNTAFTSVIVYVDSGSGYYVLTLPSAVTQVQLVVTVSQQVRDTLFSIFYAAAAGGAVGGYAVTPTHVFSAGTGDVQVSVSWDVNSDVDLHVVQPDGTEIYYGNRSVASGGRLDLDSNAGCAIDGTRIENITWPTATPPHGQYVVRVDYWSSCSVTQTNYVVTVQVKGSPTATFTGSLTGTGDQGGAGSGGTIKTFTY